MEPSRAQAISSRIVDAMQQGAAVFLASPADFLDDAVQARLRACLDDEELSRMARFRFEVDRHLYLVAHGLLRAILGSILGKCAAELRFCVSERGRPELESNASPTALRFNISHTSGMVACAIANGRTVGVDVEHLDRRVDIPSLSRSVLSDSELEDLQTYDGPVQRARFFELWTLKEAHIKALGHGLGLPLRDISFIMPGAPPVATAVMQGASGAVMPATPYRYVCNLVGPAHQLAIAVPANAEAAIAIERVLPEHGALKQLLAS